MKIKIDHIAKIEGHAGFTADIVNGQATKARLSVLEGARLLEGILRNRHCNEVSQISARICGVCPVVHNLTSLKTLEDAMRIRVSDQTILLRKLLMMGQIINSHALHIFFFSLSDFFGIKNDLNLIKKFPHQTQEALALREFGNYIIRIIGGRSIHPLTPTVGGFTKLPNAPEIKTIGERAKKTLPHAIAIANLFAKLEYPNLERKTDFVSLVNDKEYAIYDGPIRGGQIHRGQTPIGGLAPKEFMPKIIETQISEDAVKRSAIEGEPFMVGAIARINNNSKHLNPLAKKILKASKIKTPSQNPFHNILAQAIEIVHCVEETIRISREYSSNKTNKNSNPNQNIKVKQGKGYGAIEAPRGTLFYFYEVGDNGLIKNCNIITPTAQNLARLEKDLEIWLPSLEKLKQKEIKDKIKMLIRAYDPCLTCATH